MVKVRRGIGITGIDMVVDDTVRDSVKGSKWTPEDAIPGTEKKSFTNNLPVKCFETRCKFLTPV